MRTVAVLLAAGRSERFGEDKLWIQLNGAPLWTKSYQTLMGHELVEAVGIVCSEGRIEDFKRVAPDAAFVVGGGASRTASARNGLKSVPAWAEAVLFHDAARPFVSRDTITGVVLGVKASGACFPATVVTDTVRQKVGDGFKTLDRSSLVSVQTPQGAKRELFEAAFALDLEATDDVALLEAAGISATMFTGDPANIKVTHRSDLKEKMTETRTGHGYDVHRFSIDPARPLWLGGVKFDGPGLEGHSDADAVIHAVVDALLGGAGLGDIGEHFPNTDSRWKGEPSATFLKESAKRLASEGWNVVNIDISVIAERPRLSGRRDEIRTVIAGLAGITPDRVSIKATTNEGLGSIGRGEGVAAFAVATIKRLV